MAPKKKEPNAPKKSKVTAPPEFVFITLEEVKARERRHEEHLRKLLECRGLITDAISEVYEANVNKSVQQKWDDYMICDGMPTKPFKPAEIRMLLAELSKFENDDKEKTIDWLMGIDERSILTQNIYRIDRTRRILVEELKPEFGHQYQDRIDKLLQMLKGLEYYLETEQYDPRPPNHIIADMRSQQLAIQSEIMKYFDSYTYRIICSPDAYMNALNALTSEYSFTTKHFILHIWMLNNVPIRFEYMDESRMVADLHSLKVIIRIPFSVLMSNLTVRGIRLDFDHYSPYAKSNKLTHDVNVTDVDLVQRLKVEWDTQVRLQTTKRQAMKDARHDYEETMKAIEEELARQAKDKNKSEKRKSTASKLKKPTKEPPIITENTYPDIWKDFLAADQLEFENEREKLFHPDLLLLLGKEINLRQYHMSGGIYLLEIVDKPPHNDFVGYNMTWHEYHHDLHLNEDVRAKRKRNTVKKSSIRMSAAEMASGKFSVAMNFDEKWSEDNSPFLVVTFELPAHLTLWDAPIVCQHQIHTVYVDISTKDPNETEIPIVPPPASDIGLASNQLCTGGELPTEKMIYIADFVLNVPLDKPQIRHLARHCLPRIISSLKFPLELRDEADEINRNKPKGQGGTLVRRKIPEASESEQSTNTANNMLTFNYALQTNPERLFPQFPTPEPLKLCQLDDYMEHYIANTNEPNSISTLLNVIDGVKDNYMNESQKILNQPSFKMIVPKVKKKPKQTIEQAPVTEEHPATRATTQKSIFEGSRKSRATHMSVASAKHTKQMEFVDLEIYEEPKKAINIKRWTTEGILHTKFDKKNNTLIVWTDRLGTFGFAIKTYQHFPFREWSISPSIENPNTEIQFKLETFHAQCYFYITKDGYRGYVTEATKKFVRNRMMYLDIKEPTKDIRKIKKIFRELNCNIFPEADASYYVENGPFTEKLLACEMHTYMCMSLHSNHLKFSNSVWNRTLTRREMMINLSDIAEKSEEMLIHITPESNTFVAAEETVTPAGKQVKFRLTEMNYAPYADLHDLIESLTPIGVDPPGVKNPDMILFLKQLLCLIKPLSFTM